MHFSIFRLNSFCGGFYTLLLIHGTLATITNHTLKMKDTLEYKILKYLKENDNGEYLDMSKFITDLKLLRIKLDSLSEKPNKYISFDGGSCIMFGNGTTIGNDCILAKIELNGLKYLSEVERENKIITNNGILIQDSDFSNSQNKNTINEQPNIKPDQKSPLKKAWELFTNNKLIVLLIGISIEEITWGNVWKFMFDLFL